MKLWNKNICLTSGVSIMVMLILLFSTIGLAKIFKPTPELVEVEKDLASEIATIQEELFKWGAANGIEGTAIYDTLINQDTMSLHTRFNNQFMIDKKRAIEKRDINWFKTHYIVDEEVYNTQFEFFKVNAFKLIDEEGGGEFRIQKARKNWLKKFDQI